MRLLLLALLAGAAALNVPPAIEPACTTLPDGPACSHAHQTAVLCRNGALALARTRSLLTRSALGNQARWWPLSAARVVASVPSIHGEALSALRCVLVACATSQVSPHCTHTAVALDCVGRTRCRRTCAYVALR